MIRIVIFMVVGLLAACDNAGQVRGTSSVDQELIALTKEIAEAGRTHNRSTFERIAANDYVFTHSNGVVMDRATEITALMSADSKWTSAQVNDDAHARVYGDVGIVTGSEIFEGSAPGMTPGRKMMTMIFVKRNGQWQCVGGQFTNAPIT
jgi:hypothetical protein